MSKTVSVSLDTSVTPNVLQVHDHGGIHINHASSPQTITWNLTGPLAQGEFVPMSDPEPGFEWVSRPKPSSEIFNTPSIGSNGNSLSIADTNPDRDSHGTWIYKLRVEYNGNTYATTSSAGIEGTSNNPVIINR